MSLISIEDHNEIVAKLKAENERLKWALSALMEEDFRGHSVADRLQFRPLGCEILAVYHSVCEVKNV